MAWRVRPGRGFRSALPLLALAVILALLRVAHGTVCHAPGLPALGHNDGRDLIQTWQGIMHTGKLVVVAKHHCLLYDSMDDFLPAMVTSR